jgi:hypothetical protein
MLQLKKVFNYSISIKANNEYKTIYILCNKSTITLDKLKTAFKKSGIPISPDVISILNKILTKKITETMMNINNKFNIVIYLTNNINESAKYLLSSMKTNNIRNINLLLPNENIDTYYKLTESILIQIYSMNIKDTNSKTSNFFINYLNSDLSKQIIQNIIFITKTIFICKNNTINKLEDLTLEPKIKLATDNSGIKYLHYKPSNKSNKTIILIGPINVIYAVITMCSLLNKKVIIEGYINTFLNTDLKELQKTAKNSKIIKFKQSKDNIIEYSQDTSKKMIQDLLNESIEISEPITFKASNNIKNLVNLYLKNECLAVRLLAVL